ncbi:MAG TPA: type IV toxin-antitoxin system AbiEi family antitoxin domain-containing protein [Candidatus Cybelea sp.]|nr:type IV toxin-antitoxin system AbiEi family antitoxin domain-containing protein [Candidatus Cybelea sp.]
MAVRAEDRLLAISEDQDGYFAIRDAVAAGISAVHVQQLLARGRIERLSRGVYRLRRYPASPHGDLWAAALWPRGNADVRAVLSHETALLLHGGTDANPASIHVTVPKGSRIGRQPTPPLVLHYADLQASEIDHVDGLPVTTPERTLSDLRADAAMLRFADEFERALEARK